MQTEVLYDLSLWQGDWQHNCMTCPRGEEGQSHHSNEIMALLFVCLGR